MTIRIVADSTCDLPESLIAEHSITIVPLYINFGSTGYLDGVEITRDEFYRRMPDSNPPPTTATPGIERFRRVYERLAEEGASEVLSIHISISLSATVDVARKAAQETRLVPVTVLDSRQLSLGTGFLVLTAAQAAAEGRPMGEILAALEAQIKRTHVFAALDTLEYLRRSGRMNGIAAGLGALLQIKPLLTMYDGKPGAERVRTRDRALKRLLEMIESVGPLEKLAIVHSSTHERVQAFKEKIRGFLPDGDIICAGVTPVLGAHIGPDVLGVACVAAPSG